MLELSSTIPEPADKVGIPTLRRTIPELSRFLHCAEHIYFVRKTKKYRSREIVQNIYLSFYLKVYYVLGFLVGSRLCYENLAFYFEESYSCHVDH